ncbi:trypsin-like serine protease [Haloferula sp. A504]|uniref:trypsin-like serine protease n=1 Tax=Haloferula sp. A504 TaxID=3373601 RepID=UPI0031C36A52|nr:S1 family peptidase [Verrucomicrobiaceae bacterium E54]
MATLTANILAGGEFDSPPDTPSNRLDTGGGFSFVGALEISNGVSTYKGSAVAISENWIITAGHNADLNDDGLPDPIWSGNLHLPGYGSYAVAEAFTHPAFTGFANPSINDDIALMRLANPLPPGLVYPSLGSTDIGDIVTLVGFGRSGYGSYGYTSSATLTDRRFGSNVIDTLSLDDEGSGVAEVFRYDFDDPSTTGQTDGSLGNDLETIIGPGDSGGAALMWDGNQWVLVGINTFTEGYGGRFGDIGGGVLVEPYEGWILETTGIPEPGAGALLLMGILPLVWRRVRVGIFKR